MSELRTVCEAPSSEVDRRPFVGEQPTVCNVLRGRLRSSDTAEEAGEMATRDSAAIGSSAARSAFTRVDGPDELEAKRIHRFVVGLDEGSAVMSDAEVAAELNDPFATLLLRRGVFPKTAIEVLAEIDKAIDADSPLRRQMSFIVGEGSQIPFTSETAEVSRGLRLAITRGRDNVIDLIVSTAATGDFDDRFLQVMGWDDVNGVFHFYERRGDTWVWAGSSLHSLTAPSRGEGPFDSHVNGSMVMKELKFPWNHWHSVAATVPPEIFAEGDPARDDLLFTGKSGAEVLETAVVIPGVERWTQSRFAKTVKPDGTVENVPQLLRQLFETTTVNLISSTTQSRAVDPAGLVDLPATFFVDVDALTNTLQLASPPAFAIAGQAYLDLLQRFEVALTDGGFRQRGDTHFAFLVPERALEDQSIVNKCVSSGLLTDRFVACALMVDFSNPVFSDTRAQLMKHVPETASLVNGASELSSQLAAVIEAAAAQAGQGSAEQAFMANWNLGEGWRAEFDSRLTAYYTAVTQRLTDQAGLDDIFRLAESRRHRVMESDISERRPLLFAHSSQSDDATTLAMSQDAAVAEVAS